MTNRARYFNIIFLLLITLAVSTTLATPVDDQLRLIRGAFQDGLFDIAASEGIEFLKNAGNHPAKAEVNLILGTIGRSRGLLTKCKTRFLEATQSDDPAIRLQAYYELASLAWNQNEYSEAAEYYQLICDENRPGMISSQAKYWLVKSLFQSGDSRKTIDTASAILSQDHSFTADQIIELVFLRGISHIALEELTSAVMDLKTVFESETPVFSKQAAESLSKLFFRQQNLREADLWAAKRLNWDFHRSSLLIRVAMAMEFKDWTGAIYFYNEVLRDTDLDDVNRKQLELNAIICESRVLELVDGTGWIPLLRWLSSMDDHAGPELTQILGEWVMLVENGNVPAEAIDCLNSFDFWLPEIHGYQLAQLRLLMDDPDGALRWLVRYFQRSQRNPDVSEKLFLARLLTASGDSSGAALELQRLSLDLDTGSADWDLTFQQADLYFQAEVYQKAAAMYQEILIGEDVREDMKIRAMARLAESYFQMKEWVLSAGVFSRFREEYGERQTGEQLESIHRRLILCLVYSRQWAAAVPEFETYFSMFSETEFAGEMYYLRGMTEANTGQLDAAVKTLGLALDRTANPEQVETVKDAIRRINMQQTETNIGKS